MKLNKQNSRGQPPSVSSSMALGSTGKSIQHRNNTDQRSYENAMAMFTDSKTNNLPPAARRRTQGPTGNG